MADGRGKDDIGKPFYNYVQEKVWENRTGREITKTSNARPLAWGQFMEGVAFEKMDLKYDLVSKERIVHPDLPWSGMPDLRVQGLIGDIKNPWTIKSFCALVDSISQGVEAFKENHKEYYWQLGSNAALAEVDRVLIAVHVPYKDELEGIRERADYWSGDQNEVAFVGWAPDEHLPYILRDHYYKDLNLFEFEFPKKDIDALTARVELAAKELKKAI